MTMMTVMTMMTMMAMMTMTVRMRMMMMMWYSRHQPDQSNAHCNSTQLLKLKWLTSIIHLMPFFVAWIFHILHNIWIILDSSLRNVPAFKRLRCGKSSISGSFRTSSSWFHKASRAWLLHQAWWSIYCQMYHDVSISTLRNLGRLDDPKKAHQQRHNCNLRWDLTSP